MKLILLLCFFSFEIKRFLQILFKNSSFIGFLYMISLYFSLLTIIDLRMNRSFRCALIILLYSFFLRRLWFSSLSSSSNLDLMLKYYIVIIEANFFLFLKKSNFLRLIFPLVFFSFLNSMTFKWLYQIVKSIQFHFVWLFIFFNTFLFIP